jgi:maleamate amidohydrolase
MSGEDIYRSQHFGQATGFGRTPALLVIDFVNGFADPAILGGGNIAEAITATVPLLADFRRRGLPVIFTRIVYAEDGSDAGIWCEKVPRLRGLTEAAHASHVVDELAPRPGEIVIRKTQASAFFHTPLAGLLMLRGIDTLIVAGCTTSGCVRASVVDAISMNLRTVVARDCVGDRALEPHAANLFDMGLKYADLLSVSEIIAVLDRHVAA